MAGELVKQAQQALVVSDQSALPYSIVTYEYKDDSYYFRKIIDGDRFVEWKETDQDYQESKFVGADFDQGISKTKREYYIVAAACGLLTASLSTVRLSDLANLKKELEDKDLEKYVISAARAAGYKKGDYKGAVKFITGFALKFANSNIPPSVKVFLSDLSSNSKVSGLVFSIITQFTKKKYQIDEKGKLKYRRVPKYYVIGDSPAEKILYGILYWVFALAVNSAVLQRSVVNELNLPKELLKVLEDLLDAPLLNKMPQNIEVAEELYSGWIKKWFEDSPIMEVDGTSRVFNLLQMIKSTSIEAIEESIPVLLNECLFRGFYFFKKLSIELNAKQIKTFEDLSLIDPHDILPFNNQIVSKMAVIASGAFMAADFACAAIRVLIKRKNGGDKSFGKSLLAEANIAGIGRFILAVGADSKYWVESVRILFVKNKDNAEIELEKLLGKDSSTNAVYDELSLNSDQARLLYWMESDAVMADIRNTENESKKELKRQWLAEWQERIVRGLNYQKNDFFSATENEMYEYLQAQISASSDIKWVHLLAMELALFEAYHPIGSENDKEYSKLKYDDSINNSAILERQFLISSEEWKNIKSKYKSNYSIISGKTKKIMVGASISTVAVLATGGLASIFAGEIAVLLAGGTFAGLHGAALTSASLAFFGGGALAVGGGGVAAGTAVITGGGALLGAASSGSVSLIALMAQANPGVWAEQGAKLATFCGAILCDVYQNFSEILRVDRETNTAIEAVDKMISEIKNNETDLDKDLLKLLNQYQTYLERTEKQIHKILK